MLRAILFALCLAGAGRAMAAERPLVVLVVVDGLDARVVSPVLTPTIAKLARGDEGVSVDFRGARAVMPSVTNTNHMSLVTGVYPAGHGIVGNQIWERGSPRPRRSLDRPELAETQSIFDALAADGRKAAGAAIFGKGKLADLFRGAAGLVWADLAGDGAFPDSRAGLSSDERTTTKIIRALAEPALEFLFINLGDVDRTSHVYGQHSAQARKAIIEADRQVGRLVKTLKDDGHWPRTVLVITADHGFSDVSPAENRPYPTLSFGRELRRASISDAVVVSNGGLAFVYLRDAEPAQALSEAAQRRLKEIREIATAQPEVADALYRRANTADGGDAHTVGKRFPDWRIEHPRVGDVILVAKPGHQFNDPAGAAAAAVRGTHGGPGERAIPLIWAGGWAGLGQKPRVVESVVGSPDVGMTVRRLLEVGPPLDREGRPIPAALCGHVLEDLAVAR